MTVWFIKSAKGIWLEKTFFSYNDAVKKITAFGKGSQIYEVDLDHLSNKHVCYTFR